MRRCCGWMLCRNGALAMRALLARGVKTLDDDLTAAAIAIAMAIAIVSVAITVAVPFHPVNN